MAGPGGGRLLGRLGHVLAGLRGSFVSVFDNRNLLRVHLALLASLTGDLAYATAVTVWAFGVGGAGAVGVFTAVRLAASALAAPVGAALADRFSRRSTMLATDAARAVLVAAAAVYLLLGFDAAWPVFVLATAAGVLAAPFRAAQRAWMPVLAEHPRELTASNATSGTLESVAVFAGPALGGALLLLTSVPTVFLLDVATFVVSILLVLGVRATRSSRYDEAAAPPEPGGMLAEVSAGFRTVLTDGDLRLVTGQVCAQMFVSGASKVFLVVLAVDVLRTGASGVGFLDAVLGAGAILGGLVAVVRASRQRLGRDMTTGVLLWSAPLLLIVALPATAPVVVALVLVGVANPLVDVNLDTIVQRMTAEHLLARVFGALDTCYIATGALGSLVMPLLLAWLGLQWSLALVAIPVALVALLSVRRMEQLDTRLAIPDALPLLMSVPLFAPLSPAVLESLARSVHPVLVPAGDVVVAQGGTSDRFYVIESGAVEVTQDGRFLRTQHAGDFFGEIGLLRDVPRTATVTATQDTVLQALDRERFLSAVAGQHRSLAEEVAATRLAFRG